MDSSEQSSPSGSSTDSHDVKNLAAAAEVLRRIKAILRMQPPLVNPPCPITKLTGAQWMKLSLDDPTKCIDNLRMSRDAFLNLHDRLLSYGLKSTKDCGSMEALGLYIWTCAHGAGVRECRDRFERSLDTISRKTSKLAEIMFRWAQTVLVPADRHYTQVSSELAEYAPWFDGCIGAIDGTHIPVEVNQEARVDFINRDGEVSINVCAIVDMHGRFTYVGAGKAGACHDMAVLQDCQADQRFPHPPPGRYYLADSGYMEQQGYMTPFRDTRYHRSHFRGVDVRTLDRHEKFNYIHSKLRNIIERRFGHLKERWHILEGVPFFRREKQAWIIISCFAMENYLWLRQYGDGSTYDPSEWVAMNTATNTSELRELVSAAVWPA
ncbi:putative nuclease HARBI1 isoform X1 [Panicum virgatum]|uniref:putative nuclease HARBI1 isoform X1 n=1 Tax=Panicum virgatum TaxID=38727 RepID=UPI0019D5D1B0|nr:putative nuclease HARBI1 [Panicum virgatum]XP_039854765.1 putative nuclease HARBI1 isoform X1 [Panicum virgatum]